MNVGLRFEATAEIGIGHQHRCSALGAALDRRFGAKVTIITDSAHAENLGTVAGRAWEVISVATASCRPPLDLLIVDLLPQMHDELKLPAARFRLIVMDELAEFPSADLIVVPNLLPVHTSGDAMTLSGSNYIILDPEFDTVVRGRRRSIPPRLLACFGGSDPANISAWVLPVLQRLAAAGTVQPLLVLGPLFGDPSARLPSAAVAPDVTIIHGGHRASELFAEADLALVAGGTMMYESCFLGIPTAVVAQNESQAQEARILAAAGAAVFVGDHKTTTEDVLSAAVRRLCTDGAWQGSLSRTGAQVIDGRGVTRIVDAIGQLVVKAASCTGEET